MVNPHAHPRVLCGFGGWPIGGEPDFLDGCEALLAVRRVRGDSRDDLKMQAPRMQCELLQLRVGRALLH